ncbi:DUF4355 domain-containing protein [Dehalobacter sp. TeCB1]|uniref:DUF4355 domain-containing protein n=1 Tax=Dehalobacter sp. TeCB1 TaxID=1843715 RepID=UPI00083B3E2A|nr:DUF4355 domain-containing protein [Dehalobacter sp. TeCB1]OCZ53801.1 hypothetical protein A7D23_07515 [Dehalobacter sp. TeCB1]
MSEVTNTQVPGTAAPAAGAAQPPAAPAAVAASGTGQQTDKTYTAEELAQQVQEQVQKSLAAEKEKWEKDSESKVTAAVAAAQEEAVKMAKMTDDEKAKAALAKQQADIDAKAQALTQKEIRMDAAAVLTEKKLPAEALDFVVGNDAKTTTENIDKFAKVFNDAVQKSVEDRLKGTTPSGGGGSGSAADTSKMTDAEYYKWVESQKK